MKFEQLFGINTHEFFTNHWEKNLLCSQSEFELSELASPLFKWDEKTLFDMINYGDIIMVKNSQYLKHNFFKKDINKALQKILYLWEEGFTFYSRNISSFIPSLEKLEKSLEEELFPLKIQSNIFATPENKTGFNPHFDCHDVFVIQISGKKKWKFWSALKQDMDYESPTKEDQLLVDNFVSTENPLFEKIISPGEVIYIPRGVIHTPEAIDSSVHLTLWVKSPLIEKVGDYNELDFARRSDDLLFF